MKFKIPLALLVFILAIFFSIKLVKTLPDKPRRLANDLYLKLVSETWHFIDFFNPKVHLIKLYTKNLDQLDLSINHASLTNLKTDIDQAIDNNYIKKSNLTREDIDVIYQGQIIPATIKLHGTTKGNFKHFKKSYSINLKNQSINDYQSFNLLNSSQHQFFAPLLTNHVANKLGLYYNQQFPVLVSINSTSQGVYLFEQDLDQQFLEKHNLSKAKIIKLKDTWAENHYQNQFGLNAHHLSAFDFEIANLDPTDSLNPTDLYQLNLFFKALKAKDINTFIQFLDLEYMAKYDAYREFFGIDHDVAGDNLKFIYNPEINKLYPIVRGEGDINPLSVKNGTTLASFNSYDPHIAEQFEYPRLFLILHLNPEFRQLKYQHLYQLIQDYDQLQAELKTISKQHANAFIYDIKDDLSIRQKKQILSKQLNTINSNVALIKQQLEFGSLFINLIQNQSNLTVEIIPDSVSVLKINSFQLQSDIGNNLDISHLFANQLYFPVFDEKFHLVPKTYTYITSIPHALIKKATITATNQSTGLPVTDIHVAIAHP